MENPNNKFQLRAFEILISVILLIVSGMTSWTVKTVVEHGNMLAAINGNRFTAEHGLKMQTTITELAAKIPKDFPPTEYKQLIDARFAQTERRLLLLEEKMSTIGDTLTQLRLDTQAIRMSIEAHAQVKP
jgi:hypothetical protein